MDRLNRFLDATSEFLAHRKGLLPLVGMGMVMLNYVLQFIPGWVGETNLFLHLGVLVITIGIMLAWAL